MTPHEILRKTFGYESFRPGQEGIVTTLLEGRNVLAVMPTGSGKSLCYQVPALARGGLAIVVSPLVALMQDQVAALKLAGVAAESINSAQDRDENIAIWRRVAAGEVRLLYLSPERLMTERMISALSKRDVRLIAIDEAHCISQWGPSFRPEYDMLQQLRQAFPGVPIGAFTATADEATRRDIVGKIFGGTAEIYVAGFDRPNISLTVAPKDNAKTQLLDFLDGRAGQSGIVYALSRKSTEDWASFLVSKGFRAISYHAGMSAEDRAEAQSLFMTEKGVIVCATIAFGMGIDKPDVRFVFHADLPSSLDAYYQEIGRAGRDGNPADAKMVYGLGDMQLRRRFIDQEESGDERRRREHKRLDALVAYCEAPECRRQNLLLYFGEESLPCGNCDVCLDPVHLVDSTVEALRVIDAVKSTGQRFGAAHVADILVGKGNDKIDALRHTELPVFGIGKAHGRQHWLSMIRQLVGGGYLAIDVAGYGGLSISPKGHALARGEAAFRYRQDPSRMSRKAERARKMIAAVEEGGVSDELLQRLKSLRAKLAKERRVPAYVVFTDRTLIDMAARRPLTRWDFGEVHGVGESKLQQFADVFLGEITRYVQQESGVA
ncbi:DNA helicase RecQ [Aestuariivirga sp.]|uniref:DNA helicase RecQ n=1 Tax=Aestuariivirga sp. TaxID=2650926 RepID=UPI0025BD3C4F|nr:DNA helicase RecQ [Aestuariivirga sp.]